MGKTRNFNLITSRAGQNQINTYFPVKASEISDVQEQWSNRNLKWYMT